MTNDLTIFRGDDKTWILNVTNKTTDAVIDITGCTIKMTVRKTATSVAVISKYSPSNGISLTDPANGEAEVTFDALDTSGFENVEQEYEYDVEVTKTSGKKETVCSGTLTVYPDVTY